MCRLVVVAGGRPCTSGPRRPSDLSEAAERRGRRVTLIQNEGRQRGRRIHPRAFSDHWGAPDAGRARPAISSSSAPRSRSPNAACSVDTGSPFRTPTAHHISHRRNDHQRLSA